MTVNKYGNVLTIILIVLVVVILLGLGFLAYKYIIKAYKKFLKDFTRMNELKNSDYHLWEKHLLFAQALNINLDYNNLPDINMNILDNKEK